MQNRGSTETSQICMMHRLAFTQSYCLLNTHGGEPYIPKNAPRGKYADVTPPSLSDLKTRSTARCRRPLVPYSQPIS